MNEANRLPTMAVSCKRTLQKMTPDFSAINQAIRSCRFSFENELELQEQLEELFATRGFEFRREVRLSPEDRPDFVLGTIALEVKVQGSATRHLDQLARYATHEQISELILVCNRPHRIPKTINSKPCRLISIMGSRL